MSTTPEWWDDLYVDDTWARVIVGDASTLAASTHREIQIPSAWATGEVTVAVNRGSFAADASAYLYVVDSTGAVNSSGYAITFGDEGVDSTPSAFSFTDVTGAELSTLTPSPDNVTVAGIDAGQTPAITVSGTGCEYSIDGAAFTANAGTVGLDNVVALHTTSSGTHNTPVTCTVTIGGVSDSWTVTTHTFAADPTHPRFRGGGRGGWR
jgi:hypothetical protein